MSINDSILNVSGAEITLALKDKRSRLKSSCIFDDETIINMLKNNGYKYTFETVPKEQLLIYYAINLLENNEKPTDTGTKITFSVNDDEAFQDKEFLQKIIKLITDTREMLIRANEQLIDEEDSDDDKFIKKHLGEHTVEFWGDRARKSKRNVKSYKEVLQISYYLNWSKRFIKDNNINFKDISRKSSNNHKGYNYPTITQREDEIKANIAKGLTIADANRKSRIISKMIKIIKKSKVI